MIFPIVPLVDFYVVSRWTSRRFTVLHTRTTWTQADETGPVAEALLADFETEQGRATTFLAVAKLEIWRWNWNWG